MDMELQELPTEKVLGWALFDFTAQPGLPKNSAVFSAHLTIF